MLTNYTRYVWQLGVCRLQTKRVAKRKIILLVTRQDCL